MTASTASRQRTLRSVIALLITVIVFQLMYGALELISMSNEGLGVSMDTDLMAAVFAWHTPWRSALFRFFTHTGDVLLVIPVGAAVFWMVRRRERVTAALLLVSTGLAPVISLILKAQVQRPRPQVFPPLVEEATASFPSGHTLTAVASYGFIAVVLWRRGHRLPGALSAFWGLLVAFSRIYLGAHYPTDVLASIIYGTTYLIIFFLIGALIRHHKTQRNQVAPGSRPKIIPAPRVRRLMATGVTILVIDLMFSPALAMLAWAAEDPAPWRWAVMAALFLTAVAGMAGHDIWFVGRYGGSVGHRLFGLRIVCYDSGRPISFNQATVRWGLGVSAGVLLISTLLDMVEVSMILFRRDRRHIRDMLSNTMVTVAATGNRQQREAGR